MNAEINPRMQTFDHFDADVVDGLRVISALAFDRLDRAVLVPTEGTAGHRNAVIGR